MCPTFLNQPPRDGLRVVPNCFLLEGKLQGCLVTSHLNATVCGPFPSSAAARYPEGLSRGRRPQTQAGVCGRRARAARVGDASACAHRVALTAPQACVGGRGSRGERPLAPLAALSGASAATCSLWCWREASGRLSSSGAQSSPGRREALKGVSQKQAKPGQPDPRTMGPFSRPLQRQAGRHDNHPVIESQGQPLPRRSPRAPRPAVWCVWRWQLLSKEGTSLSPRDERHSVCIATLSLARRLPSARGRPAPRPRPSLLCTVPPRARFQSGSAFTSNSESLEVPLASVASRLREFASGIPACFLPL